MLYFMVFRDNVLDGRFCSQGPSHMGAPVRVLQGPPLSAASVLGARCAVRPYRPGRYFIPALKRVPPAGAPRKFRSEIHYAAVLSGPRTGPVARRPGLNIAPQRSRLVDFFSALSLRALLRHPASVYPPLFIGSGPATPHLCPYVRRYAMPRTARWACGEYGHFFLFFYLSGRSILFLLLAIKLPPYR